MRAPSLTITLLALQPLAIAASRTRHPPPLPARSRSAENEVFFSLWPATSRHAIIHAFRSHSTSSLICLKMIPLSLGKGPAFLTFFHFSPPFFLGGRRGLNKSIFLYFSTNRQNSLLWRCAPWCVGRVCCCYYSWVCACVVVVILIFWCVCVLLL